MLRIELEATSKTNFLIVFAMAEMAMDYINGLIENDAISADSSNSDSYW